MRTKAKLNILSLAEWDYAGVGYLLSKAINETTDNTCTAVKWRSGAYTQYPHEVLEPNIAELAKLWKRADVIHIHDGFFHIPDSWQKKPTIITYHGSMYRRSAQKHNAMAKTNAWLITCSTLDLTLLGRAQWMPDTRQEQQPQKRHKEFTFCHAPTSRPGKSTENVIKACELAKAKLELVERVSWAEAMKRKAKCHALLDQFTLGYGCNAIEAWMFDMPVVANSKDSNVLKLMRDTFGGELPFVQANDTPQDIAKAITRLRDDKEYYETMAQRGWEHAMRFHSPSATAKRALSFYHDAIELFYSRTPDAPIEQVRQAVKGLPGRDGMVLLRYIGGNFGTEKYVGKITQTVYEFSADVPLKYVDAKDAVHLLSLRVKRSKKERALFVEV